MPLVYPIYLIYWFWPEIFPGLFIKITIITLRKVGVYIPLETLPVFHTSLQISLMYLGIVVSQWSINLPAAWHPSSKFPPEVITITRKTTNLEMWKRWLQMRSSKGLDVRDGLRAPSAITVAFTPPNGKHIILIKHSPLTSSAPGYNNHNFAKLQWL